jgi:prevent-host-death family protein
MIVAAGKFKAKCLTYIDEVNHSHRELIITKHGIPKAKLVPVNSEPKELFGFMKGSAVLSGEIILSTGEKWEADNE